MLRVTLLTKGSPRTISGGHRYHQHLIDAARDHGAELTVAQETLRWAPPPGVDVVVIDSIAAWRTLPAVWRFGRRLPFVAMVHQSPGGSDGRSIVRRIRGQLDEAVYRRCRTIIAASPTLRDTLASAHRIDPTRLVVIEPGCDLPPATPRDDMRQGRSTALLSIANWLPNKGLLDLLDAVAALPPDMATLHLAGRDDVDPPFTDKVRARLRVADLVGRVVVHGSVDASAAAALYTGADAFALASYNEAYATVFAEALAAGLPVVGWRLPYLEHFVRDGVEGRLADVGDRVGLASALADVLADDDRRRRFAEAALERGLTLPRWSDTAERFFAEVAINGRRG